MHADGPNYDQLRRVQSRWLGPRATRRSQWLFCVGQHLPQVLRRAKRCALDDRTLHRSLSLCLCSLPAFATRVPGSAAERADEAADAADLRFVFAGAGAVSGSKTAARVPSMTAAGVLAGEAPWLTPPPPLRRPLPPRRPRRRRGCPRPSTAPLLVSSVAPPALPSAPSPPGSVWLHGVVRGLHLGCPQQL